MPKKLKSAPLEWGNLVPHVGQRLVLRSFFAFIFTVLAPGRQWGKSTLRRFWIPAVAQRTPGWATLAYVGPQHSDAEKAFEEDLLTFGESGAGIVADHGGQDQSRHIDYMPLRPSCPVDEQNVPHDVGPGTCVCDECIDYRDAVKALDGGTNEGCRVYYVSGGPEAHGQFQKHKLNGAFLDERSWQDGGALWETILPMFNTTGGHLLDVGTPIPEGPNFAGFGDEFAMGEKGNKLYDPDWNSISGKSEDNPFADLAWIAKQRALYAKLGKHTLAACLFDGKFATDLGAVFENLDRVFCLDYVEESDDLFVHRAPTENEPVCIGIDLGKHDDPTILCAISEATLEQLAVQRIRGVHYHDQLPTIAAFIRRYPNARMWCEGREGGEMVSEFMRRRYEDSVRIVKWSSGGEWDKNSSVTRGMDLCQQTGVDGCKGWKLINHPDQKEEFRKFARKKSAAGRTTYSAPDGGHDDFVAGALYAAYGIPIVADDAVQAPLPPPPAQFSTEWLKMVQRGGRGMRVAMGAGKMPM